MAKNRQSSLYVECQIVLLLGKNYYTIIAIDWSNIERTIV